LRSGSENERRGEINCGCQAFLLSALNEQIALDYAERSRGCLAGFDGRISDLLKFLVPKVGESFVLDNNVESQEVAQARPRPELAGALETILELAAL